MTNATILAHPALDAAARRRADQTGPGRAAALRTLSAALAAPLLGVVLAWGLVDACAFTQHSLMGLYAASAPVSA